MNPLSRWLRPFLTDGLGPLNRMGELNLCHDDEAWLEIAETHLNRSYGNVCSILGEALSTGHIRTFHGCRTVDVSTYFRDGIRKNDPSALQKQIDALLDEEDADLGHLRPMAEKAYADPTRFSHGTGRVYVVADGDYLVQRAGHYLLYGSEHVLGVLGFGAHTVLRRRGTPTLLELDLPLLEATAIERRELAEALLLEWTRVKVNRPGYVPALDFSFCLRRDIPPEWLVGHSHPELIFDPLHHVERRSTSTICPHCYDESTKTTITT